MALLPLLVGFLATSATALRSPGRRLHARRAPSMALDIRDSVDLLFVGGKGGVGKTSVSAAIGFEWSARGARTLLVSTDPAHSLSDAFRREFGNEPTSPGPDNLHVMEVDPTETMQRELGRWADLAKDVAEAHVGNDGEDDDGENDMAKKIHQFQEWLSGIPGIDEATALSSAIEHIESGKFDLIVFDTAPTGHTLKLLGMPDILQAGIEKLQVSRVCG